MIFLFLIFLSIMTYSEVIKVGIYGFESDVLKQSQLKILNSILSHIFH